MFFHSTQRYHPNFKPFHFLEIFCVAMEVSRVKFIPHFEHQKRPFRSLYSTCHYLWGILIPIRGEDWEGYFWIGEWYMAKLNDCFFKYMTLILMKCGVKFWVLIFKSMPKHSLKIMDLKVAPVPPISCPISAAPNFSPLHKLLHLPKIGRPFGPPFPPVNQNPWPQELKLSPQRVRFASKAAALLFAWAAKAVVEAISVVVGGGWSWLSAGRMSKGKGEFCKKVVKRCEK